MEIYQSELRHSRFWALGRTKPSQEHNNGGHRKSQRTKNIIPQLRSENSWPNKTGQNCHHLRILGPKPVQTTNNTQLKDTPWSTRLGIMFHGLIRQKGTLFKSDICCKNNIVSKRDHCTHSQTWAASWPRLSAVTDGTPSTRKSWRASVRHRMSSTEFQWRKMCFLKLII